MILALAAMFIPRPLQRRFNQKIAPHHSAIARAK
jgi:hypothetical protein